MLLKIYLKMYRIQKVQDTIFFFNNAMANFFVLALLLVFFHCVLHASIVCPEQQQQTQTLLCDIDNMQVV